MGSDLLSRWCSTVLLDHPDKPCDDREIVLMMAYECASVTKRETSDDGLL
jgi:hypothetical protein